MHFGFLTPVLFDNLIYANLAFGILLIVVRFTLDMRRKKPEREETYSESSQSHLDDTNPSLAQDNELKHRSKK
jgi:hypothetical protein